MGQTLSHGVYLPAEGERNCYSGLASNWNLLDTAIGDTAGKASATHTHGNITNDGKLATASKALVTDSNKNITTSSVSDTELSYLSGVTSAIQTQLNAKATDSDVVHKSGNETIAGNKTFSNAPIIDKSNSDTLKLKNTILELGELPASDRYLQVGFKDKNDDNFAYLRQVYSTAGVNELQIFVRNKFASGAPSTSGNVAYSYFGLGLNADGTQYAKLRGTLTPYSDSTYDLGSSSYQWNNLYAKNYYYNGVAWGLDKDNAWTNYNRFNGYRLSIKNYSQEIGVIPTSNQWNGFQFTDKNNNQTVAFEHAFMPGETRFKINMVDNVASHNSDSTVWIEFLRLTASSGGSGFIIGADARPMTNNTYELGTSTNKWKTLNGINPGALSLPNTYTNLDTTNWNLTGTLFSYTPPIDGWLFINIRPNNNYAYAAIEAPYMRSNSENTTGRNAMACIAVRADVQVTITLVGASIAQARLVTCAGNV